MEAMYKALLEDIRREFPRFRIVQKDQDALQRLIHRVLVVVTLGGQRNYLDGYQTTVRHSVYVTPGWASLSAAQRYVTMRHERIHLQQFRRLGFPLMAFLYIFVPLPLGLAWFRAHFEKQGYAESMRAAAQVWGPGRVRDTRFRAHVVEQFTSASYGWMWPFRNSVERWYDRVLEDIERDSK